MKEYNILVSEDIKRFCKVTVLADNQNEAVETAHQMWQDNELDSLMTDSALGPSFVTAEIIKD